MLKKQGTKGFTDRLFFKTDGFSLIQVAIGLMAAGFITAGCLSGYKVYTDRMKTKDTRGTLATVESAINQFYYATGSYPCPASLTATESDPDYGNSFGVGGVCDFDAIKVCTDADWENDGVCKTYDGQYAIIIGTVPFHNLKLSFNESLDHWGNRILYAASYSKTDRMIFFASLGSLKLEALNAETPEIINFTVNGLTEEADFVLLSHGENGVGAYNDEGNLVEPCGDATEGYENENCDNDDTFFLEKHPYVADSGTRSEASNETKYDDLTRFQISVPYINWFPNPIGPQYIMTLAQRIGIGTPAPAKDVHVVGKIRAGGAAKSGAYCDNEFVECFWPELITGEEPVMQCDFDDDLYGDQALLRLAENSVHCMSPIDPEDEAFEGDKLIIIDPNIEGRDCTANVGLMIGFEIVGGKGRPKCRGY